MTGVGLWKDTVVQVAQKRLYDKSFSPGRPSKSPAIGADNNNHKERLRLLPTNHLLENAVASHPKRKPNRISPSTRSIPSHAQHIFKLRDPHSQRLSQEKGCQRLSLNLQYVPNHASYNINRGFLQTPLTASDPINYERNVVTSASFRRRRNHGLECNPIEISSGNHGESEERYESFTSTTLQQVVMPSTEPTVTNSANDNDIRAKSYLNGSMSLTASNEAMLMGMLTTSFLEHPSDSGLQRKESSPGEDLPASSEDSEPPTRFTRRRRMAPHVLKEGQGSRSLVYPSSRNSASSSRLVEAQLSDSDTPLIPSWKKAQRFSTTTVLMHESKNSRESQGETQTPYQNIDLHPRSISQTLGLHPIGVADRNNTKRLSNNGPKLQNGKLIWPIPYPEVGATPQSKAFHPIPSRKSVATVKHHSNDLLRENIREAQNVIRDNHPPPSGPGTGIAVPAKRKPNLTIQDIVGKDENPDGPLFSLHDIVPTKQPKTSHLDVRGRRRLSEFHKTLRNCFAPVTVGPDSIQNGPVHERKFSPSDVASRRPQEPLSSVPHAINQYMSQHNIRSGSQENSQSTKRKPQKVNTNQQNIDLQGRAGADLHVSEEASISNPGASGRRLKGNMADECERPVIGDNPDSLLEDKIETYHNTIKHEKPKFIKSYPKAYSQSEKIVSTDAEFVEVGETAQAKNNVDIMIEDEELSCLGEQSEEGKSIDVPGVSTRRNESTINTDIDTLFQPGKAFKERQMVSTRSGSPNLVRNGKLSLSSSHGSIASACGEEVTVAGREEFDNANGDDSNLQMRVRSLEREANIKNQTDVISISSDDSEGLSDSSHPSPASRIRHKELERGRSSTLPILIGSEESSATHGSDVSSESGEEVAVGDHRNDTSRANDPLYRFLRARGLHGQLALQYYTSHDFGTSTREGSHHSARGSRSSQNRSPRGRC